MGGRIGLASSTPDGFIGQLFKSTDLRVEERHYVFRYRSPEA